MRENFNEDEDSVDDDVEHETPAEAPAPAPVNSGSKAWRSIERYREMRELRKHLDDFQFEDDPKDLHL